MTPLEKVARAICRRHMDTSLTGAQAQAWEDGEWTAHEGDARAALEALRVPSEEMADVGAGYAFTNQRARLTWDAMISQALSEEDR